MRENSYVVLRRKQISYAVSLAMASLMSGTVLAQDQKAVEGDGEVTKVLVVGTRASQQTAIDRKKNAATAMDSIIAEDVGAFPDRNVGEAISRIAGIALDRGDFGEGINVTVRGNTPDLTRVEIDGQGVQAGGADLNGRGEGRGVELRELSSDLIKSVDVVKGSTADMTEGSLGGGIIIKTRTGLDFKKQFLSARVSAAQNSINKKVTPDLNLVFADKYLDGRLGVVFNGNMSKAQNEGHSLTAGGSNNQAGTIRAIDFDNSPNKTFSYLPDLLTRSDASVDQQMAVTNMPAGVNSFAGTPREVVTKSAAAATKQDCYAAFPALTTAQQNSIPTANNARIFAITQRGNELLSCLNQWNDYTPNAIRYFVKRQTDERRSGDLRFDFKVNENLTVYGKGSSSKRTVEDYIGSYSLGGMSSNPATLLTTAGVVPAFTDSAAGVRSVTPGYGYYLYPSTASFRSGAMPAQGAVANVIPGSVVVDDAHHVTKYTITDGSAGVDMAKGHIDTSAQYFQTGGTYRKDGLKAEFFVGDAKSKLRRIDKRVQGINQYYGQSTISVLPDGTYTYEFPASTTFNQLNYDAYAPLIQQAASKAVALSASNTVAIPAYTAAQKPLVTPTLGIPLQNTRETDTGERTGKLDLTYSLSEKVPFLTNVKFGLKYTDTRNKSWFTGGQTLQDPQGNFGTAGYVPGVYLPNINLRSSIIGCQDTPGSLGAGGQKCDYGYVPSATPATALHGPMVLPPDAYKNLIAQSLVVAPNAQFYHGAKDRPDNMLNGWYTLDIDKFYALSGIPNYNLDCLKSCTASDGKTYDQPYEAFREKTTAGYLMTEFEFDRLPFTSMALPFGMELSGNAGVRYVKVNATGSGFMTFTTIRKTANYDPANPAAAGGTVTSVLRKNTSLSSDTTDLMPIYNLALWMVPNQLVLRYNQAKTIARPGISRMLPSASCTYDERLVDVEDGDGSERDQRCSGVMGNPGLKPFTNINRNLSLEWYVNKDTMFSAAAFKQAGRIGAGTLRVTKLNQHPFAGSAAVDPVTGVALKDLQFTYDQWENQPATTRTGVELGTKTAFTFLPWFLRYTGLDANYTRNKSTSSAASSRDLLTGESLPVPFEPKYSYNASLWYDDGAFSARIALQVVAPVFSCISPCSGTAVNNFPADGAVNWRVPYNPGSPVFTNITRFVDAKMAYRFRNGIEIFAEGRNLNLSRRTTGTGGYANFADGTPNVLADAFYGSRIMIGANFRMQ